MIEEDGAIPKLMRGVGADIEFVKMDEDGFDTLVFPDFRFRIPANLDLYRERLVAAFPSQQRGIDRYVRLVRELMLVGQSVEQHGGKLRASTLWQIATRGRLLATNQRATIGQFLDSCSHDPKLRAVILGQHGDYALPPSEVSAFLHAGLAAQPRHQYVAVEVDQGAHEERDAEGARLPGLFLRVLPDQRVVHCPTPKGQA